MINGTITFEPLNMSDLNISHPSEINNTTDPDESFNQSTGSFSGFNITLTPEQFNSINNSINTTKEDLTNSFGGGKRIRKKRTVKKKRSKRNKKRSRSRR